MKKREMSLSLSLPLCLCSLLMTASSCCDPASATIQKKKAGSETIRSFRRSKSDLPLVCTTRFSFPPEDFSTAQAASAPCMESSISCTTFNILAPIYKRIEGEDCRESQFHDAWLNRNMRIIDMLRKKSSSIICLQELWLGNEELVRLYDESLRCAGYLTFKLARTSDRGDGLLTAIKSDRITVLNYRELRLNDCGDRVAQFFHLRLNAPFYKRNQTTEQQLLLVNTHLLFPHNSSYCLIRLWQVYKIIECLEHFKAEHGLASVPVILCGDWNGSKRGHVYKFLCSQGFVSSYDSARSSTDNDAHRWVSHRNHRGNICGVDFIWLRNPSNSQHSLSSSWREAVLSIIKAKLSEAGISEKEIFGNVQPKENGRKLSLHEFQKRLHQLGLTGKCSESLTGEEIKELMQILYVDAKDLIDHSAELEVTLPLPTASISNDRMPLSRRASTFKDNMRPARPSKDASNANALNKYTSEKAAGFIVQDASLFPPEVERGSWPEDYLLSDHAPLTAVFKPKRVCDLSST
eukprot:c24340_g2_i1 orf=12-1574(+)